MLGAVSLVLTKELDVDQKSDIIEQFTHKIIINLCNSTKGSTALGKKHIFLTIIKSKISITPSCQQMETPNIGNHNFKM